MISLPIFDRGTIAAHEQEHSNQRHSQLNSKHSCCYLRRVPSTIWLVRVSREPGGGGGGTRRRGGWACVHSPFANSRGFFEVRIGLSVGLHLVSEAKTLGYAIKAALRPAPGS